MNTIEVSLAAAGSHFLPHGYCLTWDPPLLWTMVASNFLIGTSYYSIPIALVFFIRRQKQRQFSWILVMFSIFIFACGTTHLLEIVDIWVPIYHVDAAVLSLTAAVSLVTAVMLWPLVPQVSAFIDSRYQSQSDLQTANANLTRSMSLLAEKSAQTAESEQRFRLTLDNAPNGILLVALDGRLLQVNQAFCAMLGYRESELLQMNFQQLTHPDDLQRDLAEIRRLLDGVSNTYRIEKRYLHKQGRIVDTQLDVALMRDERGRPLQFISQIQDITEQRRAERELRSHRQRLSLLIESATDYAMVILDLEGRVVSWNLGAERIEGYLADEILGQPLQVFYTPEDRAAQLPQRLLDKARSEGRVEDEGWRLRKDGTRFWANVILRPLRDDNGELIGFSKITRDLTDRRRKDEAISAALRDKETLLKEVYHRVKNNLQVISSLLTMQIRTMSEGAARNALNESAGRVRAMALVHEKLYQSGTLSSINLDSYIDELRLRTSAASGTAERGIRIDAELEAIDVGLDIAVPLGLILNELVSNSLNHAFPDNRGGLVKIRLRRIDEGQAELCVADTGCGLPPDLDIGNTPSLGLKLVTTLARQIDGRFAFEPAPSGGTHAVLRFTPRT